MIVLYFVRVLNEVFISNAHLSLVEPGFISRNSLTTITKSHSIHTYVDSQYNSTYNQIYCLRIILGAYVCVQIFSQRRVEMANIKKAKRNKVKITSTNFPVNICSITDE